MKNINKILSLFVVLVMMLSVIPLGVQAETEFNVTASVNYDTSVVTIGINTPAKYVQKIAVVIFEKDREVTSPADFIRALEVKTRGKNYIEFDVQLAEDDPAGYLVVSASGHGTKADVSKDTTEIYFESQTYIEEVTLPALEGADKDELAVLLNEKADMLLIDRADLAENTDVFCDLFLNIREKDYDNKLNDMGSVEGILSGISLIREFKNVATEEECKALCESQSELLTLDLNDSDYNGKTDDIYKLFYANLKDSAPECITDIKEDIFQSIAMANFNKLVLSKIAPVAEKYIEYFGISLEEYTEACDKYGANEIDKAFVGRNFLLAKEVKDAFDDVVKTLEKKNDKPSGGGGGGGGGGSVSVKDEKEYLVDSELLNENESVDVLPELPAGSMFNDVPSTHWAHDAVNELYSLGVINGVSLHTFDPDSYVTREAFVKMYVMAFDIYDETSLTIFKDLLGHWANLYVASAQVCGIVKGIDNHTFGVGQPITRQDAAVMLMRVLEYKGIELDAGEAKPFTDENLIADYAKESVAKLSGAGIISGVTDTEFAPTDKLTRAQAAKLIYGALKR